MTQIHNDSNPAERLDGAPLANEERSAEQSLLRSIESLHSAACSRDSSERKPDHIRGVRLFKWVAVACPAMIAIIWIIMPMALPCVVDGIVVPATVGRVQATIEGRVVALNVAEGTLVGSGDTLGRIDPLRERQMLEELRADLVARETAVATMTRALYHAEKEYNGVKLLHESGDVSQLDLDRSAAAVDGMQYQVEEAEAVTQALRVRLTNSLERLSIGENIVAGSAGIICSRVSDMLHSYVRPGDTICEIMSERRVVELQVDDDLLVRLHVQEVLYIRFAIAPRSFVRCTVMAIHPLFESETFKHQPWVKTANARVLLTGRFPDEVRCGMSCRAFLPAVKQVSLAERCLRFVVQWGWHLFRMI